MKKKYYLFAGTILLFLICGMLLWNIRNAQTIAASTISVNDQKQMEAVCSFSEDLQYQLLCNQATVPYDLATDTYYLPQTADGRWLKEDSFTLTDPELELYWCADDYWEDIEAAIARGHAFSFLVVDGNMAKRGKVVFTGLPMLKAEIEETYLDDQGEPCHYCKVSIFDPYHHADNFYDIEECYGYLGIRGRTSKYFPKKGWDLTLVKENGTPYKTMLFGLRSDDDWKLNALYPDSTKLREQICMELWDEISACNESPYDTGTHMQYFEMFVDQEYLGLYGAMEQIDYKQLSFNKNEDILYKSYAWPGERHPELYEQEEENFGHLIKTGGRVITDDLWEPLLEYVDAAKFDDYGEACDPRFLYDYIKKHMDMNNFICSDLYVQTLYAYDNKYKNFYLAADIKEYGDYTLWKIPWDLNYTFGDRFDVERKSLTTYNLEWSREIMPEFMLTELLLEFGNTEFAVLLNEKWQELRNGIFSIENVQRIAEENRDLLEASGAFARDEQRWPEGPHDLSIEPILEFHSCRLQFLDEHYSSFLNEN